MRCAYQTRRADTRQTYIAYEVIPPRGPSIIKIKIVTTTIIIKNNNNNDDNNNNNNNSNNKGHCTLVSRRSMTYLRSARSFSRTVTRARKLSASSCKLRVDVCTHYSLLNVHLFGTTSNFKAITNHHLPFWLSVPPRCDER